MPAQDPAATTPTATYPSRTPPSRKSADNAPEEQEKLIKFNTLLANCVIFHNALDITNVVRGLVAEGWTIIADQLAALSPYLRAHISRFGAYTTDELTDQPDPLDLVLTEVDFTTLDLTA
ncbi:Tn3 family transposase [Nocardia sp. KC 131]|uniref:Tn3 family transposase n=1 Tax=Nocardia arseniciresistens TaxID=3392119 RepID=UPI00398F300A